MAITTPPTAITGKSITHTPSTQFYESVPNDFPILGTENVRPVLMASTPGAYKVQMGSRTEKYRVSLHQEDSTF